MSTYKATINNTEYEILVRDPNVYQQQEGQKIYNKYMSKALLSKHDDEVIFRDELDAVMRKRGLWDDQKETDATILRDVISRSEEVLDKGGVSLKVAKKAALDLHDARVRLNILLAKRMSLDAITAEAQAEDARFNYWVSACLVYNDTGKPVFSSLEDYMNRASEEYAIVGASKLANLLYGIVDNYQELLPENKFLKEFGFVDDDYRLINKDGHYVDRDGNLVNELGELVDENDNVIKTVRKPFLDDDGNPIGRTETCSEVAEVAEVAEEQAQEG